MDHHSVSILGRLGANFTKSHQATAEVASQLKKGIPLLFIILLGALGGLAESPGEQRAPENDIECLPGPFVRFSYMYESETPGPSWDM